MSTKNSVFQVLVTKGNQAPLAAAKTINDLKPGQIGVFDADSNKALDADSPGVKNFFLAVGIDENNRAFSAGQYIQKENVRDYNFRPHTAGKPQIFEITNFDANCETDYTIRFEFRNIQVMQRQGTNQFTHAYSVRTSCCGCNPGCPSGSSVELAKLLFDQISSDTRGMFKVEMIVGPAGEVIADPVAYAADPLNAQAKPGLRITVNGGKVNDFLNISSSPFNPRQTVVIPSLIDGFNCTGKITVTQQATSEEGNGTDIKLKEYFAGGWNGRPGPYRVSSVTGLAKNDFVYFADGNTKYDQINLIYDHFSRAGWGEYSSNIFTIIAVPETDTVTRDGLLAVIDAQLTARGFDALADDAATASPDPTVVEKTSQKTAETDGIA